MSAVVTAADVVIALAACGGASAGGLAWFYRRGRTEGVSEKTMIDNTRATADLTNSVQGLRTDLVSGFQQVHERLNNHEVRISLSENDIKHIQTGMVVGAKTAVEGGR